MDVSTLSDEELLAIIGTPKRSSLLSAVDKVAMPEAVGEFGKGLKSGVKERALGVSQLIADQLPVSEDIKQDMTGLADLYKMQRGKGLSSLAGEIAGDPFTYMPLLNAPVAGGVSGATLPVGRDDSRAINTAIGAGTGYALQKASPYIMRGAERVGNVASGAQKFITGSMTDKQAQKAANEMISQTLVREGISPETLSKVGKYGMTLPEATGSSTLLKQQKIITKGEGKAANYLSEFNKQRAGRLPEDITKTLTPIASLKKKGSAEFNRIFAENDFPIDVGDIRGFLEKKIGAETLPNGLEQNTYKSVLNIIDDAQKAGSSLKALHSAKMELDNLIAAAPSPGIKKVIRRNTVEVKNLLTKKMDEALPDYGNARKLYERGSAGERLIEELQKTRDGSIGVWKNKVFGSEASRNKLKNSLTKSEYNGVRAMMNNLDDLMKGGLSGSDTAFNAAAQRELQKQTGAQGIEIVSEPLNLPRSISRWYTDKVRQKDYEAIAKAFTNPDVEKIGKLVEKHGRKSPQAMGAFGKYMNNVIAQTAPKDLKNKENNPYSTLSDEELLRIINEQP